MRFFLAFILNTFNHGWQAAITKYRAITSTSLDDMVFENREKEYGAYMLRKNYPWHLVTALAVVILVFLYLCFLPVFMGWLSDLDKNKRKVKFYKPEKVYTYKKPEKKGYMTPPSAKVLSRAELEGIRKQLWLRIDPSLEARDYPMELWVKEIRSLKGLGDRKRNKIISGKSSYYKSPDVNPDTTLVRGNQYPPIKMLSPNIIEDFFCGLTPKPDNRVPEKIIEEQDPATCGCFPFADEEPQPVNLEEVKNCLTLAPGQSSYYFVFRVLVDKKGNYVKHRLIHGPTHRYSKKIGNCLSQLHFTPAIHKGKPIPFWVNIPFRLEFK